MLFKTKYRLFFILFLVFLILPYSTFAQNVEQEKIKLIVENYFEFLKNGDLEGISNIIADPMKVEKGAILDRDSAYSSELIRAYENKQFQLKDMVKIDNLTYQVSFLILSMDGHVKNNIMLLRKENDSWKISEEIGQY